MVDRKLIPVVKQATYIRMYSGILGKIAITLSPVLIPTIEDNSLAALIQRERKLNIIIITLGKNWKVSVNNISCASSRWVSGPFFLDFTALLLHSKRHRGTSCYHCE